MHIPHTHACTYVCAHTNTHTHVVVNFKIIFIIPIISPQSPLYFQQKKKGRNFQTSNTISSLNSAYYIIYIISSKERIKLSLFIIYLSKNINYKNDIFVLYRYYFIALQGDRCRCLSRVDNLIAAAENMCDNR